MGNKFMQREENANGDAMNSFVFFILPIDAKCEIGDDGWVFESVNFIPDSATQKAIDYFSVPLKEKFLEIRKYQNDHTQINIVCNEDGKVNEIFIRTRFGGKEKVLGDLSRLLFAEKIQVFDPTTRSA